MVRAGHGELLSFSVGIQGRQHLVQSLYPTSSWGIMIVQQEQRSSFCVLNTLSSLLSWPLHLLIPIPGMPTLQSLQGMCLFSQISFQVSAPQRNIFLSCLSLSYSHIYLASLPIYSMCAICVLSHLSRVQLFVTL